MKTLDSQWQRGSEPFCSYCQCETCQFGPEYKGLQIVHAKTEVGTWICDICFTYECCLDQGSEPCSGICQHRPVLITEWMLEEN